MELRPSDIPRTISILDGRGTGRSHKRHAGTREKCVNCGTPTYRTIGRWPVCSQCDKLVREEYENKWRPADGM